MKKDQSALLAIISVTIILVLYFGVESRITLYVIFLSLILTISVVSKGSDMGSIDKMLSAKEARKRSPRENRLIMYYILSRLSERKSLNLQELASEVSLELNDLSVILKFLEKEDAVKFMYPPMQQTPLVVENDPHKTYLMLKQLKSSLADQQEIGEDEFKKKVAEEVSKLKNHSNTPAKKV